MEKKVKVVFDELPREGMLARLSRLVQRKPRPHENVNLQVNGHTRIIKRGVEVELEPYWLQIAEHAPVKYNYSYRMVK